jgi:hypothetical protein
VIISDVLRLPCQICVSVVSAREGAVYMHAVATMAVKETKEVARFVVTISERGRWGRGGRPGALAQVTANTDTAALPHTKQQRTRLTPMHARVNILVLL